MVLNISTCGRISGPEDRPFTEVPHVYSLLVHSCVGQDILVAHEFESPVAQTLPIVVSFLLQEYTTGGRRRGRRKGEGIGYNEERIPRSIRRKMRSKGTGEGEDE
jgi:hypothetical protein